MEEVAEMNPVNAASWDKLQNIASLEKPIACKAPNSLILAVNDAYRVFKPPINAPIEMRMAEIQAIHRIGE